MKVVVVRKKGGKSRSLASSTVGRRNGRPESLHTADMTFLATWPGDVQVLAHRTTSARNSHDLSFSPFINAAQLYPDCADNASATAHIYRQPIHGPPTPGAAEGNFACKSSLYCNLAFESLTPPYPAIPFVRFYHNSQCKNPSFRSCLGGLGSLSRRVAYNRSNQMSLH